jgi:acetyl-CoA synthetase
VLNVSGHRMGTMEIESALVSCTELVAEAAVVGPSRRHHRRGDLRLRRAQAPAPTGDEAKKIAKELRNWVGQGDRPDRQAQGHPLRREPAQDPLRQDHAPPAALSSPRARITQDTSTLENPQGLMNPRAGAS